MSEPHGQGAPKLFGTAGIRGNVRDKMTEKLALDLGRAISTMLANKGQVVVGCDCRITSGELKATIQGALMGGGVGVLDAGVLPTPVLAFGARELKAEAGVMITASHNPPEDNGVKCYSHEGREYIPEEEEILEQLISGRQFTDVPWDQTGRLTRVPDIINAYVTKLEDLVGLLRRRLRIVVDCANGTAYNMTPLILSRLGCEVISLNAHPDGRFPGRPPEPNPANLVTTCRLVRDARADLGIAHDGDGDRLALIDEQGRYVNNDTVLAFFARLLLEEHGPGKIITTVDTSSRIDRAANACGGTVERTRLGKTQAQLTEDKRKGVRLCCEPWKIIDPAWGFWGDAIYTACRVVQALDRLKGSSSALFRGISDYPQERLSFRCPDGLKDAAMKRISDSIMTEKNIRDSSTVDGVRVNFSDESWILIRKSGTEPKIRVYCEGHSRKRLRELVSNSSRIVNRAIKTPQTRRNRN